MNNDKKLTGEDLFRMVPGLKDAMTKSLEEIGIPHEEQKQPFDIRKVMPEADAIIRQAIRSYGRRHNKETGEFEDMPETEGLDKNE